MTFAFAPRTVAVVGAAETTELGTIPNQSVIGLHADAALNAIADAGLTTAANSGPGMKASPTTDRSCSQKSWSTIEFTSAPEAKAKP